MVDYGTFISMLVVADIKFSTWRLTGEEDPAIRDGYSVSVPGEEADTEFVFDQYGSLVSITPIIEA